MAYDWHVGMKVVCVDAGWKVGPFSDRPQMPIAGCVYTIRDIEPLFFEAACAFRFEEIINRPISFGNRHEPMFHQKFFRPVINAERDLAEFEAILRGVETKREVVEA